MADNQLYTLHNHEAWSSILHLATKKGNSMSFFFLFLLYKVLPKSVQLGRYYIVANLLSVQLCLVASFTPILVFFILSPVFITSFILLLASKTAPFLYQLLK